MTEAEWLECISPEVMLEHLGPRASGRKKRLFACACVRRIEPLLQGKRLCQALDWFEGGADHPPTPRQLQEARRIVRARRRELEAAEARRGTWRARAARFAAQAVEALLAKDGPRLERPRDIRETPDVVTASRCARTAARAAEAQREERSGGAPIPSAAGSPRPLAALDAAEVLREVFGNPFRPMTVDAAWLAWEDGAVAKLARALYVEGRFQDLPVLADALEEAGCADPDILKHCRTPVEHVRGCWVIDALLGMT